MRNPLKAQPVTQAEIRKFKGGRVSSPRVAEAAAAQARQPKKKSLAAQSAAHKRALKKQQGKS